MDDILAILLAFSTLPEELQVLLISVTYGNIDIQNCLRNVVSLFYHVENEIEWRKAQGLKTGFETLIKGPKPLVALGPDHPLEDEMLMADFFRKYLAGMRDGYVLIDRRWQRWAWWNPPQRKAVLPPVACKVPLLMESAPTPHSVRDLESPLFQSREV